VALSKQEIKMMYLEFLKSDDIIYFALNAIVNDFNDAINNKNLIEGSPEWIQFKKELLNRIRVTLSVPGIDHPNVAFPKTLVTLIQDLLED